MTRGARGPGGMQLERQRLGHVGACSLSNNSEFGFYSQNSGKPWEEFKQRSEMIRCKVTLYCGKSGLEEGWSGRRDTRLEFLSRDPIM